MFELEYFTDDLLHFDRSSDHDAKPGTLEKANIAA